MVNSKIETTLKRNNQSTECLVQPRQHVLGFSAHGLPIVMFEYGRRDWPAVLCMGGVHGDEIEGVTLAWSLWSAFRERFDLKLNLLLLPVLNPDGVLYKTRVNANQVDLNRNLPTQDWTAEVLNPRYPPGPHAGSEPETKAFLKLWSDWDLKFIFSFHSWKPLINTNGNCEAVAAVLHKQLQIPVEPSMGYPTPGALGTFSGLENGVPTITLEIERGLKNDEVLQRYQPPMVEALCSLEV